MIRHRNPNRSHFALTALLVGLSLLFLFGLSQAHAIGGEGNPPPGERFWYFRGVVNDRDYFWSADFTLLDDLLAIEAAGVPMERNDQGQIEGVRLPPTLLGNWFFDGKLVQAYGYNHEANECFIVTLNNPMLNTLPDRAVWVECQPIIEVYGAMYDLRRNETTENDL